MGQMCVQGNKNERRMRRGGSRELMRGLLLLAVLLLRVPSSAQSAPSRSSGGISRLPVNVTVAVGKRAELSCGTPRLAADNVTLTLHRHNDSHSLTCLAGQTAVEKKVVGGRIRGTCKDDNKDLLAVWTIGVTALSDNGVHVVCQHLSNTAAAALTVYDKGDNFAIIIGCTIGGFITTLLFFGVAFRVIRGSEKLQQCFRGPEEVEDDITMVSRE